MKKKLLILTAVVMLAVLLTPGGTYSYTAVNVEQDGGDGNMAVSEARSAPESSNAATEATIVTEWATTTETSAPLPSAPPATQPSASPTFPAVSPSTTAAPSISPPATLEPTPTKPMTSVPSTTKPVTTAKSDPGPVSKLKALRKKNSEAIGWIVLDGTGINFPIMQARSNEYYLEHDEYKNPSKNGAVALDYQLYTNFTNGNNILYAHNLSAPGKGFSDLVNYKKKTFFDANKTGMIYTPDKNYRIEIFAVYVTDYNVNGYAWFPPEAEAFDLFVREIKSKAMYYREKNLKWGDQILSMCTCSWEFANARTIVHAKLVEI